MVAIFHFSVPILSFWNKSAHCQRQIQAAIGLIVSCISERLRIRRTDCSLLNFINRWRIGAKLIGRKEKNSLQKGCVLFAPYHSFSSVPSKLSGVLISKFCHNFHLRLENRQSARICSSWMALRDNGIHCFPKWRNNAIYCPFSWRTCHKPN